MKQVVMDSTFGTVHRAVAILDKYRQPISPMARDQFELVPQRYIPYNVCWMYCI